MSGPLPRADGRALPDATEHPAVIVDSADGVVICGHPEVLAVAHDPERFSNAVSRFRQLPNGLDGAEHDEVSRLLAPFLSPASVAALEPMLHRLAGELIRPLAAERHGFDAVAELGARYAVRAQSRWLGWRPELEQTLLDWVAANRAASRSGSLEQTSLVAQRFDAIIGGLLAERRGLPAMDVTGELMSLRHADGRSFSDEEIVSVLRNWTGGDLASLALCTGVLAHWLAEHPQLQRQLASAPGEQLDAVIDEVLRLDDPFPSNRRRCTSDTVIAGHRIAAGTTVRLDWRAANQDRRVFGEAAGFDPAAHRAHNLVYGTGVHACPGRELATRELRVLVQQLLAAGRLEFDDARRPERELPPCSGFRTVPVRLVP